MTRLMCALLFAAACGSSPQATTTTMTPTPTTVAPDDPSCPLLVPGTTINVEDTQEGPAYVFVTTGDVAEVRKRGMALATMNNDRTGRDGEMGMVLTGKATATASEIDGGVRVVFKAADPAASGALGDEMRMHGSHLAGATSCAM